MLCRSAPVNGQSWTLGAVSTVALSSREYTDSINPKPMLANFTKETQ